MFDTFLAQKHYGVDNEKDLRDKIYGTRSAIFDEELNQIFQHLSSFDSPNYVEVGVYFGGTFSKILELLGKSNKEYHAIGIDLFEDLSGEVFGQDQTHELYNKWNILNVAFRDDLRAKLEEMGRKNFTLKKGMSDEVLKTIPKKQYVILIDGNHTYNQAKKDYEAALSVCESGSIIVFDNSSNDIEPDPRYVKLDGGPWKVCEELKNSKDVEFLEKIKRCSFFKVH